jgi:hypothetical protein
MSEPEFEERDEWGEPDPWMGGARLSATGSVRPAYEGQLGPDEPPRPASPRPQRESNPVPSPEILAREFVLSGEEGEVLARLVSLYGCPASDCPGELRIAPGPDPFPIVMDWSVLQHARGQRDHHLTRASERGREEALLALEAEHRVQRSLGHESPQTRERLAPLFRQVAEEADRRLEKALAAPLAPAYEPAEPGSPRPPQWRDRRSGVVLHGSWEPALDLEVALFPGSVGEALARLRQPIPGRERKPALVVLYEPDIREQAALQWSRIPSVRLAAEFNDFLRERRGVQ